HSLGAVRENGGTLHTLGPEIAAHLLRAEAAHHKAMTFLADLLVIGERNRSAATSRSRSSPSKRSRSDCGRNRRATGAANRPPAALQKPLPANDVRHHARHRSSVRLDTPISKTSFATRPGVGPFTIADTSTTTAPK